MRLDTKGLYFERIIYEQQIIELLLKSYNSNRLYKFN